MSQALINSLTQQALQKTQQLGKTSPTPSQNPGGNGFEKAMQKQEHAPFKTQLSQMVEMVDLKPRAIATSSPSTLSHHYPGHASGVDAEAAPRGMNKMVQTLMEINEGQLRMDRILDMALMGRKFSSSELLVLQTQVYRISQELEIASKVVEKTTQGVQTTFRTQLS